MVAATTFTYAFLSLDSWKGDFTALNNFEEWVPVTAAFCAYLFACFTHVNIGGCYPSDCLLSFVPAVLVIFTNWMFNLIGNAS